MLREAWYKEKDKILNIMEGKRISRGHRNVKMVMVKYNGNISFKQNIQRGVRQGGKEGTVEIFLFKSCYDARCCKGSHQLRQLFGVKNKQNKMHWVQRNT